MESIEEKILKYVSRETYNKFQIYKIMLDKWNRNTSLVQHETINEFMERHILDSLQLLPMIDVNLRTIDIGTGGGFPGMVLSISGMSKLTLCDSNQRKTIFLKELARHLKVDVEVVCSRVEELSSNTYNQIISRACADLATLLNQTLIVSRETKLAPVLFCLKGKIVDQEIDKALKEFNFSYQKIDSVTNKDGVILKVTDIHKLS